MKSTSKTKKDLHHEYDGKRLVKAFCKRGATLKRITGDHGIVEYKHSTQVVPMRPLGKGLQSKVIKWAELVGLLGAILLLMIKAI